MPFGSRFSPALEPLEDRLCPAITGVLDAYGNLQITGVPTLNNMEIDVGYDFTTGLPSYTVLDNGSPISGSPFETGGDVVVDIGGSFGNDTITVDLAGHYMGNNLLLSTGYGSDTLNLENSDPVNVGTIPGSLLANRLNNISTMMPGAGISINGSVVVDSSRDNTLAPSNFNFTNTIIGGSLAILAGNNSVAVSLTSVPGPSVAVGQSVYLRLGNGSNSFIQDPFSTINGGLTFLGGSGADTVMLSANIGGSVYLDLQGGANTLMQNLGSIIEGNLTLRTGIGNDTALLYGDINGTAYLYLSGGDNMLDFSGNLFGRSFSYIGGTGRDTVNFNGNAERAYAYFNLGAGSDDFTLGMNAALSYLYLDMGFGINNFTNLLGFLPFASYIR